VVRGPDVADPCAAIMLFLVPKLREDFLLLEVYKVHTYDRARLPNHRLWHGHFFHRRSSLDRRIHR
jgi:hypothetical protein